jgi:hypothetical protein
MKPLATLAPPEMRDEFLRAIDHHDRAATVELATHLTTCSNRLPGITCAALGLPFGSSYSDAAERVLGRSRVDAGRPDFAALVAMAKGLH